jgi:hypothetical protein
MEDNDVQGDLTLVPQGHVLRTPNSMEQSPSWEVKIYFSVSLNV